ncbi:MAG: GMC family oxidoreductase [Rhodocyclaceae bacterium]|nr:MAG: GMC family oxidoreductase [Rhodocyclaceae bacterium]
MNRYPLDDGDLVVIIGSGAGGGTLANELCQRGIRCVVLEAGPRFTTADFQNDELAMAGKLAWPDSPEITSPSPLASSKPYVGKGVGGTTMIWSGISVRLRAWELKPRTTYGAVAGASLIDWPISYEELTPYYALAEKKMSVTGTHGNSLLPANNNFKVLYHGATRLGYREVSTGQMAIQSQWQDDQPPCMQIGFCMQGCKIAAKWSTLYTEIPKAEATGRLDLRTGCLALQIHHDDNGRVTGVLYADEQDRRQFQKARVVCVAANAVASSRLLLNSASGRFADGLANSSGQVGRNYVTHTHTFVMARMPRPVHAYRGAVQAGLVHDERRHDPARGFAGGYMLQMIAFGLPFTTLAMVPGAWGEDLADFMQHYTHLAGLLVMGEDMPQASNRITLSKTGKDRHGLPIASIHLTHHANDLAMTTHAVGRADALYQSVGAQQIYHADSSGLTHNLGTNRMSARPDEGVVNGWGQAHEVPNLFISDGSQFASSGSANPTLTIVALAIRQAEFIARQLNDRAI